MRLPFGLELRSPILRHKWGAPTFDNRGAWFPMIHEPFTGAWQRNVAWTTDTVLAYHAVNACITLIAQDVGKLRPKLVEQDDDGIWTETRKRSPFLGVIRRPNTYQNHIQFKELWITSKLVRGNTYALKERDQTGVVRRLYILDPSRVKVLVAPDGSVFYELAQDNLSGLLQAVSVPASEIIHDRMNCLFHPLVGTSPIFACGLAAHLGLKVEGSSAQFFGKGANPSGVLTAPGFIEPAEALRLQHFWNTQFSGDHAGAVAILGDGLKFEPLRMSAVDAQLIEQLKWTAEVVCSTFHVPPFKVGVGAAPTYPNAAEALNQIYYSDCLQSHIESFEAVMDEGLGLTDPKEGGKQLGVELDLSGLLRMDSGAQMKTLAEGIGGTVLTPNEARKTLDLKPVKGGDAVLSQQQNFSVEALAERDKDKPFAKPTTPPPATPAPAPAPDPAADEERAAAARARMALRFQKSLAA